MRRLNNIIFLFFFLCIIPGFVEAKEYNVEIKSIKLVDKSENAEEVSEATFEDLNLSLNVKLHEVHDYVKYEIILYNGDNVDYKLKENNSFDKNEYISYTKELVSTTLKAKSESIIYITMEYKSSLPEESEKTITNSYSLDIDYEGYSEDDGSEHDKTTATTTKVISDNVEEEKVENPNTGISYEVIVIGTIVTLSSCLIFIRMRKKGPFKTFMLVICLIGTIVPIITNAKVILTLNVSTTVTIGDVSELYTITIDPNGGVYNKTTEKTIVNLINGKKYIVEVPTYDKHTFKGWTVVGDTLSTYNSTTNEITINNSNITLKANWLADEDVVAIIKETEAKYESIQAAYNAASNGQTVILKKNTTENTTNNKNIIFDLNNYTQTGSLTNTGNITIYNGTITSDDIAITNNGTLTLGINDDEVNSEDCKVGEDNGCVAIIGANQGINTQNGTFNMYDGYIKGTLSLLGGCKDTPIYGIDDDGDNIYYHAVIDQDKKLNYQYVYLADTSKAVSKTITGGEIYYYNLQDNFNNSMVTNYDIYAVRNFEAAYALTVNEDKTINFYLNGYTVTTGNDITNNGTLNIKDTKSGVLNLVNPINNNNTLNLEAVSIVGTTKANAINNLGNINLYKTTITTELGYVVYSSGGTSSLTMDDDSYIIAKSTTALYICNGANVTLNGGNIDSKGGGDTLYNNTGTLTITGGIYTSTSYGVIDNKSKSTATITGGTFSSSGSYTIYNEGEMTISKGTFNSNGSKAIYNAGEMTISDGTVQAVNYAVYNDSGKLTMSGGTFNSTKSTTLYIVSGTMNISGGIITSEAKYGLYNGSGKTTIIGGTIKSNSSYGLYNYKGTLVLGIDDDNVSTSTPEIIGETYGLYISSSGTVNFYDGILKGKTAAINGNVNLLPDGYTLEEDEKTIDDNKYITNYLVKQEDFLEVNGEKYNSFEKAFAVIDETGTIKVIASVKINNTVEIPSGKNIILDLNNQSLIMTSSFTNNGTLKIIDNSSSKSGSIKNIKTVGITNTGNLTIEDGNFETTSGILLNNTKGTVIINGGVYTSKANYTIYNNKTLTINGGTFCSTEANTVYSYSGTLTINGGTITSSKGNGLYSYGGTIIVAGGSIISNGDAALYSDKKSSSSSGTITITITGGTIASYGTTESSYGIYNYDYFDVKPITITGGTIISSSSSGIYNYLGTITLGKDDDNVSTSTPEIIGETYGLYVRSGKVNFYDGILKGKTDALYGNINLVSDGYALEEDEEIIDDNKYVTNYLVKQEDFLEVNGEKYNSFKKALASIAKTGTIKVIASVKTNNTAEIPSSKNIILDLNNQSLIMTSSFTNSGTLNITDSSSSKKGSIKNIRTLVISNTGNLTIEEGNFESTMSVVVGNSKGTTTINGGMYTSKVSNAIFSTKTLIINGGTFYSPEEETIYNDGGTLTINGGTITSTDNIGVYQFSGTLTINDGTIISEKKYGLDVNSGKATINGGTFKSGSSYGILNFGTLTINDGTITSEAKYGLYNGSGKTTIIGGTIKSNSSYGLYNYKGTLVLGIDDDNVSISTPEIIGETYGLYASSSGTVNFYDGILKGKTSGYSGTITSVAKDHIIVTDSEEIEDETYTINYLVEKVDYILNESTNTAYSDLQTAIDEASNGDTLIITKSSITYENISIPSDKEIIIDLGENVLEFTDGITNNGTLLITSNNYENNSIKSKKSDSFITNNGKLDLKDINIKSSKTIVLNNGEMTIDNSILNSDCNVQNGENGVLKINNSTLYGTSKAVYNYGTFDITDSNINLNMSTPAIYNYSSSTTTSTIKGGNMNYIQSQKSNKIEIENLIITNNLTVSKDAIVSMNGGSISSEISNSGTISLINCDIVGQISNSGTMDMNSLNISFSETYDAYPSSSSYDNIINNSGTMNLDNVKISTTRINASRLRIIYNSNNLNINDSNIDVYSNNINSTSYAIYNNNGTANINSTNMNIDAYYSFIGYGIYVNNGTVNYKSGNIYVNCGLAYGIYITNGTVTMGEKEDTSSDNYGKETANVSTTDPSIKAIGYSYSTGIGVKKTGGYFNYYDGIITGSTSAKPETASDVEYKYQVETYTDEDNHEYCILEYMKENIKN